MMQKVVKPGKAMDLGEGLMGAEAEWRKCGRLEQELIARPVNRHEKTGMPWIFLDLLAELADMHVNGTGERIVLITPNGIQQLIARY